MADTSIDRSDAADDWPSTLANRVADTVDGIREFEADVVVLCTGSRPRIPAWCEPDQASAASAWQPVQAAEPT